MSTRANIIIEERGEWGGKSYSNRLYFYRHSDGYPEGVKPTLDKFVDWMKRGLIRNNLIHAAGWIILLGAIEYNSMPEYEPEDTNIESLKGKYGDVSTVKDPADWKVGAYEPTSGLHGDIEHLYLIDLKNKEWSEISENEWDKY